MDSAAIIYKCVCMRVREVLFLDPLVHHKHLQKQHGMFLKLEFLVDTRLVPPLRDLLWENSAD